MFLITGCGRSGTLYTATLLQQAGLDVGHECTGVDGAVSSLWAVRDSHYPLYHAQSCPDFDVALHQVREPLVTIASLTTAQAASWRWVARHIDIDPRWSVLRIAAEYWLAWNALCEARAVLTYRIEAIDAEWGRICALVGKDARRPRGLPTNINSRAHRCVTWTEIRDATPKAADIREMAARYGYTLEVQ